jgi:putative ABC transport system permease protein
MFRNYLKIAFRSLRKSKGFTALDVIGLAAGLGVCLLIVLYVNGAALANPIKSLRSE